MRDDKLLSIKLARGVKAGSTTKETEAMDVYALARGQVSLFVEHRYKHKQQAAEGT